MGTMNYRQMMLMEDLISKWNIMAYILMEFSSHQEVGIEMLPDKVRRSRESKLVPFVVKKTDYSRM